ncbi:L7Ae/L30e/S12e/Gadd45 family ribosomal protein [Acetivibrio ethanolgignens]|uniref:50S ribosomal protein L7ae n=1 Tax=Acetivibrio ethanolgignens TaxID=290052 RepID=A0A0V8QB32_9FIRM|nr:ribosomal L7Ae/L30e/S12e/Gadd45 family protein [Acetivibrio ethanolgignens]KSV57646.1 50S ribosomal protein L7ae [Acetivibrio ethanolgignens]
MIQNKVISYIGLATKSGNIASGEFMTEKAVKEGSARLVIVAEDSSDNTKKKFTNMCEFYQVPIYFFGDKESLGHGMGKEMRASLAILDQGFADAVEKQLK